MTDAFSVVLVASMPPPIAGQSLATRMLVRGLSEQNLEHAVVNLSRPFFHGHSGWAYTRRAWQVAKLPFLAWQSARRLRRRPILLYLQIGQSRQALLRDLPLFLLARMQRWPVVLHLHGAGLSDALKSLPTALQPVLRDCIRNAAHAVVLSPSLRRQFEGLLPEQRISVVANGVEDELVARAHRWQRKVSPGPGLSVLYLSNFIAAKGYATVLQAARLSQQQGRLHRFVLAGALTENSHCDPFRFVRRHDLENTQVHPPIAGPARAALFEQADVLVLPSRLEGQPLVILEAMHFGLPIVATAVGGIPDIVCEPDNGLFIPGDDPARLLAALDALAASVPLRQAMAAHNVQQAANRYTEQHHAAAMLAVFRRVAKEDSRC